MDEHTEGHLLIPVSNQTQGQPCHKPPNPHAEYPNWECKHDTSSNEFNPVFSKKASGPQHLWEVYCMIHLQWINHFILSKSNYGQLPQRHNSCPIWCLSLEWMHPFFLGTAKVYFYLIGSIHNSEKCVPCDGINEQFVITKPAIPSSWGNYKGIFYEW